MIASGGVGSLDDLRALRDAAAAGWIEGVIVGRALYDGRVALAEALALLLADKADSRLDNYCAPTNLRRLRRSAGTVGCVGSAC